MDGPNEIFIRGRHAAPVTLIQRCEDTVCLLGVPSDLKRELRKAQ